MTELIVSTITDNTYSMSPSELGFTKTHAWMVFSMYNSTTKIRGSHGISSLVDGGVGEPVFYLTEVISSATAGSSRLGAGSWTAKEKYPLQTGSRIRNTREIAGFCGGSNTARGDVGRGYFSLNGV